MKKYSIEFCPFGYRVVETDGDRILYLKRTTRTGFIFCDKPYYAKHYKRRNTAIKHVEYLSAWERMREEWEKSINESNESKTEG